MISFEALDDKLKILIKLCKETRNYKKLAITLYILTSNLVDEIGIKLGIRARKKDKGEKLLDYLQIINDIFQTNLKISIFTNSLIQKLNKIESLFLRNKGNIPKDYIKELVEVYYELRKINIPNLYDKFNNENLTSLKDMNFFSFLTRPNSHKNVNSVKPLIMHKINIQEKELRSQLSQKFNPRKFEEVIYLKKVKDTLRENNRRKIPVQGSLKEHLSYQIIRHAILKNFILGIMVVSFSFGFSLLFEMIYYPYLSEAISFFLLISFGIFFILMFIYWINSKKD